MIEKILILFPGALGDILLALPVIQAIRHRFPAAALDFVGDARYFTLLKHTRILHSFFDFSDSVFATLFSSTINLDSPAASFFRPYDLAVVWLRGTKKQLAGKLKEYGIRTVVTGDPNPQPHPPIHHTHYLFETVKQLGIKGIDERTESAHFHISTELQQFALTFFDNWLHRRWVAVHPGSGSPRKNWPPENFVTLINQLSERNLGVLIPIGPAEHGWKESLQKLCSQAVFTENLALEKLAALFSYCSLYIGNDSGISHLTALIGIPTLLLFVATDPTIWAPGGAEVSILAETSTLQKIEKQKPCSKLSASNIRGNIQVVDRITVEKVIDKVTAILKEQPQTSY